MRPLLEGLVENSCRFYAPPLFFKELGCVLEICIRELSVGYDSWRPS